jgi:hypothetical protein
MKTWSWVGMVLHCVAKYRDSFIIKRRKRPKGPKRLKRPKGPKRLKRPKGQDAFAVPIAIGIGIRGR